LAVNGPHSGKRNKKKGEIRMPQSSDSNATLASSVKDNKGSVKGWVEEERGRGVKGKLNQGGDTSWYMDFGWGWSRAPL